MVDTTKNIAIGVLVAVAFALIVWVLLFLHPSLGDGGKVIRVRFPNIDKVNIGTRVTFAGRPIGEVIAIQNVKEARVGPPGGEDPIYAYELALSLDSSVDVYDSDEISIRTSGLMGERCIAITPKRAKDGEGKLLGHNAVMYASSGGSVEEAFSGLNNVAKKAEKTIDEVMQILETNQQNFQGTLDAFEKASQQLDLFLDRSNKLDLPGNLYKSSQEFQNTMIAMQKSFSVLEQEQVLQNFAKTAENLKNVSVAISEKNALPDILASASMASKNLQEVSAMLVKSWPQIETAIHTISKAAERTESISKNAQETVDEVRGITAKISAGEGSLGKILNDDAFYYKSLAALNRVNLLMSDVNNYGPFFHLDKGWQRERRKRIAELDQLQSPKQFQNFINDEMQRISLSMNRVNNALDKADTLIKTNTPGSESNNTLRKEFAEVYANLLENVQSLQTTLKNFSEVQALAESADSKSPTLDESNLITQP